MILTDLFEKVLQLGVYGTIAGAGVWMLSRLIDHVRAPKWIALVLWGMVALRLVMPFSFSSNVSIYRIGDLDARIENTLNFDRIYREDAGTLTAGAEGTQKAIDGENVTGYDYVQTTSRVVQDETLWELVLLGVSVLWIAGVFLLWMWGAVSYIGLKRRLRFAMKCEDSIYEADEISSPCVVGIFAPRIYLMPGLSEKQREHIVLHEKMHIRYLDHIWKILSYLIISLHWFNPCLWLLWNYFQGELEKACDERVLNRIGEENKEDYSQSLLAMACARSRDKGWKMSVPIAFGEDDTKGRIRRILKYRKPLITVSVVVIFLGAGICAVLFTMPEQNSFREKTEGTQSTDDAQNAHDVQNTAENTGDVQNAGGVQDEETSEEIYDEFSDGDYSYQSRSDGIYRVGEGIRERIYDGYAGANAQMTVFEGKLYFLVDKLYEDGALDWADNTIRWVDLQTLEAGDLVLERENPLIREYRLQDGVLTVWYLAPEGVEKKMLYHEGETVMNGRGITELSDQEAQQLGMEMTDFILSHQGTLVNVSHRVPDQNIAYLDMDGDGNVEKIVLEPAEGEHEADWILQYYSLQIGETVMEGYSYNLANTLWAWSPDGKQIFLIIYEDGPSADPDSHFYRYLDGNIIEAGSFEADIRNCVFYSDGTISGPLLLEIIQTDWIEVRWQINDDGMLEELPQETYDFITGNEIELLDALPLHPEIGAEETFTVQTQMVKALKVSSDFNWILIETRSGEQGWVHIENYEVPELGENVMEIFAGRYLAG